MGKFNAVIFEKNKFEYRDKPLLTAFIATFGLSDFQVQSRKKSQFIRCTFFLKKKAIGWDLDGKKKQLDSKKFEFQYRGMSGKIRNFGASGPSGSTTKNKINIFFCIALQKNCRLMYLQKKMKPALFWTFDFDNRDMSITKNTFITFKK